jgi:hypothetical protein
MMDKVNLHPFNKNPILRHSTWRLLHCKIHLKVAKTINLVCRNIQKIVLVSIVLYDMKI